jgi:hypothetical protein
MSVFNITLSSSGNIEKAHAEARANRRAQTVALVAIESRATSVPSEGSCPVESNQRDIAAHADHAPISFVTVCGRVPQPDRDTLGISVCRIGVELQLDGGTYGPEERLTPNERSMEASQSSIFRRNEHNRSRVSLGKVGRRAMP